MHALVGKSGAVEQSEVDDELLHGQFVAPVIAVFDVSGVSPRQVALQAVWNPVQQDESLLAWDKHGCLVRQHCNIADGTVLGTDKLRLESDS